MTAPRSLTVELVGLPGSGKTSLVRRAVPELARRGIAAHETFARWDRGRGARLSDHATTLRELLARDRPVLRACVEVARAPGGDERIPLNLLANWANRCGHLRRARRLGGVHVLDQGAFQAYWSMAFAAGRTALEAAWPVLEGARPPVDAVVLVRASADAVARRLAARPGRVSRLERAGVGGQGANDEAATRPDAGGEALRRAERALGELCVRLRALAAGDGPVLLEVDNEADDGGAAAAARLAEAIGRLLDGAAPPVQ